jgi:hypothetical protein
MNQLIRGPRGEYLAEIIERGDDISIYQRTSYLGTYLGTYRKSTNRTYNSTGGFIGEGNLLTMLITGPAW